MKKILLAGVALVVLGAASASAADIQRREAMPAKAPPYIAPVYNWTGLYIGISGGGAFGHSDFGPPFSSGSFNTSGGLVGGTLGYNYQMGQVVLGLEGDGSWSNIRGSGTCLAGTITCGVRNNWLGTARARLGLAVDRFMPYVTGGAAFGDIKTSAAGFADSTTKTGWTAGCGIEAKI